MADGNGRAAFRLIDKLIKVPDMIGRSLAVTSHQDDLGRGSGANSKIDGNAGERYHLFFFEFYCNVFLIPLSSF